MRLIIRRASEAVQRAVDRQVAIPLVMAAIVVVVVAMVLGK